MVKSGKKHFSVDNGGKWFTHRVLPEKEARVRESCTSTGAMLTQVESSSPQALHFVRYPKCKDLEESRDFPFSDHDNKYAIRDNVAVFSQGVGRKRCPDDRRQHNSHFFIGQEGSDSRAEMTGGSFTIYQADFMEKQAVDCPSASRRFPHNHHEKSAKASFAQAKEQFMWFGKDGSDPSSVKESNKLTLKAPTIPAVHFLVTETVLKKFKEAQIKT
ncbi:testis-expressed protein 36 [Gouania willdenowi]|uniref:testis-expressed protein 36 n=1 Tax=Gouania willdenowi TaxID=441366 RepID=UPI001054DDDA|nr:testis-expressed protein 36 [Gouania willdenowi]